MKRRFLISLLLLFLLILPACVLPGSSLLQNSISDQAGQAAARPGAATPTSAAAFNATQRARQHLEVLSDQIGRRVAGTDGAQKAADYINTQFKKLGYQVQRQSFKLKDEDEQSIQSENIIAFKAGDSAREIIIGAHYDSVNIGRGADDNASGIAVLLAAAEAVKDVSTPYSVRFIAFGAEEVDLNGSRYYVSRMDAAAKANTLVMINLDSLAVGNDTNLYGSRGDLHNWVLAQAADQKLSLHDEKGFDPEDDSNDFSDHAAFRQAGIPFLYFEASDWSLGEQDGYTQVDTIYGEDGEIWHTPYDTIEYIEATFPGRLDAHLNLFSGVLIDIMTHYRQP